jgi:cell division protein FtsB
MKAMKKNRNKILEESIEAHITTLDEYRKENQSLARKNEALKKEIIELKLKR